MWGTWHGVQFVHKTPDQSWTCVPDVHSWGWINCGCSRHPLTAWQLISWNHITVISFTDTFPHFNHYWTSRPRTHLIRLHLSDTLDWLLNAPQIQTWHKQHFSDSKLVNKTSLRRFGLGKGREINIFSRLDICCSLHVWEKRRSLIVFNMYACDTSGTKLACALMVKPELCFQSL